MFKEVQGDITKIEADVIINAANTEMKHGGGVALAIARAAGDELIKESEEIGYVPIGDFAITTAGNLPAKKVFHIPTICYRKGQRADLSDIESALHRALVKVQEMGYKSVAVPLLGAGVVGLNPEEVKKTIKEVADNFPGLDVILVVR